MNYMHHFDDDGLYCNYTMHISSATKKSRRMKMHHHTAYIEWKFKIRSNKMFKISMDELL